MFKHTLSLLTVLAISLNCNSTFAEEKVLKNEKKVIFTVGTNENPTVEDGDTFWIGIHEIRLIGIDTIEDGQNCLFKGETNFCDTQATLELEKLINLPDLECTNRLKADDKPDTFYGRYNSLCFAGTGVQRVDIARAMVESGWAFAAKGPKGAEYRSSEETAKAQKLGLHQMDHKHPKDYRKEKRGDSSSCK